MHAFRTISKKSFSNRVGGTDLPSQNRGWHRLTSKPLGGLKGDLLEGILNEVVDDGDALLGDAGLRVHLLQDLHDVGLVGSGALAALDGLGDRFGHLLGGSHYRKRLSLKRSKEANCFFRVYLAYDSRNMNINGALHRNIAP